MDPQEFNSSGRPSLQTSPNPSPGAGDRATSGNLAFDFAAYLAQLDPQYIYQINKITGGVVNITVRAIKVAFTHVSTTLSASNSGEKSRDRT